MDIGNLRREYNLKGLRKKDLAENPFDQFEAWFKQACDANMVDPNAMSLATATADAQPLLRTVLLKYYDTEGFVFFTNLESTKAKHIAENPHVSLLFLWLPLARQITIVGTAEKVATKDAIKYFRTRPRGSQLSAWVSRQSSIISSRTLLEMKLAEMKNKFLKGEIPLPSFWGGYRVRPTRFEFWQGRSHRLHDRFLYLRDSEGWNIKRLAP